LLTYSTPTLSLYTHKTHTGTHDNIYATPLFNDYVAREKMGKGQKMPEESKKKLGHASLAYTMNKIGHSIASTIADAPFLVKFVVITTVAVMEEFYIMYLVLVPHLGILTWLLIAAPLIPIAIASSIVWSRDEENSIPKPYKIREVSEVIKEYLPMITKKDSEKATT